MELSATSRTARAPVLKDGRVLIALRGPVLISSTDLVAHKFALAHLIIPNYVILGLVNVFANLDLTVRVARDPVRLTRSVKDARTCANARMTPIVIQSMAPVFVFQAMLARNARIRVPLVATVTTVPTSASARTAATAPTPTACASASRAGRDYCVNRRVERDSMAKAVRSSATVITMVPATTLPGRVRVALVIETIRAALLVPKANSVSIVPSHANVNGETRNRAIPLRASASVTTIIAVSDAKRNAQRVAMAAQSVASFASVKTTALATIKDVACASGAGRASSVTNLVHLVSTVGTANGRALNASTVTVNVIHSTGSACVNQDLWVYVAKSPALKVCTVKAARANAVVKMALNVTTLLVNAVVCPVGKVKIAPCRAQQILGASLARSDAPASTMERVDRTTASVDALMDGWGLNATRFVRKDILVSTACNTASAPTITLSATQPPAVCVVKDSEVNSAISPSTLL